MKVLIINTDYPAFLDWLYARTPGLAQANYDEQMRVRNESLFGVADFYSKNLRQCGHEAWDVHANNQIMQSTWVREHGLNIKVDDLFTKAKRLASGTPLRYLKPILRPFLPTEGLYHVLAAQIRHYRPDVVLNQAVDDIPDDFLREIKPNVRFIAGQIAAPLTREKTFRSYDLMLSSLPNFVEYFQKQGIRSSLYRFAFEGSILDRLQDRPATINVSFVGSISSAHGSRTRLMETICNKVDLSWWGNGASSLPEGLNIRKHHRGVAWGLDMYQILKDSRITLNNHIDIAEDYANNMRLFEATGAGTMLVTDKKKNLAEMFTPGQEVVVYSSPEECIEVIRHYLSNPSERDAIARAGQQRTLRHHNYEVRARELLELLPS